jgi:serine/threonine protein kinase
MGPPDARTGEVVGGYRLDSLIGSGAMGTVYIATDTASGDRVALKVLTREIAEDDRFRRRFLRESALAASLDHPSVVPVLAAGEQEGILYLAMAYIEGSDLRAILRAEGRLEPDRTLSLVEQVASALDAAHGEGLVHRDVKPANILVAPDESGEHAFVCDFGLARHASSASSLTTDRGLVGTIDYIPPEQIEGGEIDGRADVYSLACVLFECLSGARPFDRESELSVVFAHLNEPPPAITDHASELPSAFDAVFATGLAKSPADRYRTCGDLLVAARAAQRGKVVTPTRRRRRRLAIAAAGAVLVTATIAVGAWLSGSPSDEPPAITPTSIAGARLGLHRADYEKILGDGLLVNQRNETSSGPGTGYETLAFEDTNVWVYFPDGIDGTASIITTWNEDYKTTEGIGPCSTIDELEAAYGSRVHPDHYGTVGQKHFMYDVGTNLLFSATGPDSLGPTPATYVPAIGLFDGTVPGADEDGGPRAFAGYVTGNETPRCLP